MDHLQPTDPSLFDVKELPDGTLAITGYHGEGPDLVIPGEIDGRTVTAFTGLFWNEHDETLVRVHLPASVTDLTNEEETVPLLWRCRALRSITVDEANPAFASLDGVLYNRSMDTLLMCPRAYPEPVFHVPDGVQEIARSAFFSCTNLCEVTLPDSLLVMGKWAFGKCPNLGTITIPAGVCNAEDLFFGSTNMFEFRVCPGHPDLTDVDGVLYDRDMTTLMAYPAGRTAEEYIVPDGVREIGAGAFNACEELCSVVLPDSVRFIGEGAFFGCTELTDINIPDGVREIPDRAFRGTGLEELELPDSVTDIGREAFADCDCLTAFTLPPHLRTLGFMAFTGCHSLTSVELPASLEEFHNSFLHCMELTDITVAPGSTRFESIDGSLFDKQTHTLLCYPAGKPETVFTIPDGTLGIATGAVLGPDTAVQCIVVPASVTSFGAACLLWPCAFETSPDKHCVVEPGSAAEAYCLSELIRIRYPDGSSPSDE